MAQETTQEFSYRFNQAVEGHPLAPATPFGRQSWLRDKLTKEASLTVSPNTMSKWFNGQAMPRADNVRKIARVLQVDEVWLSLGHKPQPQSAKRKQSARNARGAVLALAGMLEMIGGRVTFLEDEKDPADLHVNIGTAAFRAIVVTPKEDGDAWSIIVTEPVGDARILAVTQSRPATGATVRATASLRVVDLTDCPRKSLGGYSIIEVRAAAAGAVKAEGHPELFPTLESLEMLVPA